MVNRCKFLNPTLNMCSEINAPCPYMADPHSCSIYDEEFNSPYQSHPPWVDRKSEIPSFADRIEAELDKSGIDVERTEEIEEVPDWF